MKKLLLLAVAAVFTIGAYADDEHLEWTAASLPSYDDGIALGYQDYWASGYCVPGDYVLCESSRFKAYIENPFVCSTGNSKYSGAGRYPIKPLMGMNNSVRDGIQDYSYAFADGLAASGYLKEKSYSNEGVEYTYYPAIITMEVAPTEEGDGIYGMVSVTYSRGGNLSAMYVVDATANSGNGMMVLQSKTRGDDDTPRDNVARFGVESGHTYYILSSEDCSVELYSLTYDECASDSYENIISEDDCTAIWTANQLPQDLDEAYALGYLDYWASGYCVNESYTLIDDEYLTVTIDETPFLVSSGNSAYSGHDTYTYKPIMGMNNNSRSGIQDYSYAFADGVAASGYLKEKSYSNDGLEYSYYDAILTIQTPEAPEGAPDAYGYGRITLNYNRGGNLSAMYVVDATANSGNGMMVLQTATRCPNDAIKTHSPQFGVEPGHTYYVLSSEDTSVELYSIGFCPATSEKYGLDASATLDGSNEEGGDDGSEGIQSITTSSLSTNGKIYSIDGRLMGTNKSNLSKGMYIMNGKKIVVK